jgi:hypothetical protein
MKQLLLFLLLGTCLAFSSCKSDPCEEALCGDNSICIEGDCECAEGYSKNTDDRCVLAVEVARNDLAKLWTVTNNCFTGLSYKGAIFIHPTEKDQIVFDDIYYLNTDTYAVMTTATTFEIPLQPSAGDFISGSGFYTAPGRVEVSYIITEDDGTWVDNCTAVYQ